MVTSNSLAGSFPQGLDQQLNSFILKHFLPDNNPVPYPDRLLIHIKKTIFFKDGGRQCAMRAQTNALRFQDMLIDLLGIAEKDRQQIHRIDTLLSYSAQPIVNKAAIQMLSQNPLPFKVFIIQLFFACQLMIFMRHPVQPFAVEHDGFHSIDRLHIERIAYAKICAAALDEIHDSAVGADTL